MLKINNLNKFYGKFQALDNLCLEIPTGSIYGFVGPNGAGKTTTMKIIAGLLKADSGEVFIDDVNILNKRDILCEKIGYMPDFFGVYDNLKVREYLDFYADAYYLPEENRSTHFDRLLETVKLSDKMDTYVDDLSRGMKQRLCLARSIIHDPEVIILDEPASGLDPRARIEMKDVLKDLSAMGKTIIISSHILPELQEMCTHIGIMERGRLISENKEDDLVDSSRLFVTVVDNIEGLMSFLSENSNVSQLTSDKNTVEFDLTGGDKEISELIAAIVSRGIGVTAFGKKEISLEETFLKMTGGEENA